MNKILTNVLFHDIRERLDHALLQQQISPDMERKIKSRARIFFAMNEAVKFFTSRAQVPLNALNGFIPSKLYRLQKSEYQGAYNNLAVYEWPSLANITRPDGGLLRLSLNGKAFEPSVVTDPRILNIRITSLQNQADNTLMYGPDHLNAVADLNGTQVFVPTGVEPHAQIIENPYPVTIKQMAQGRATTVVKSAATSAGDITITNSTEGKSITVHVDKGEDPYDIAQKVKSELSSQMNMEVTADVFTDEIRFVTREQGEVAFAELTIDPGTTGVTFSEAELTLEPKETEMIPVDYSHQDTLAVAAFNHMMFNVASLGGNREQPRERAEEEAEG